RWIVGVDIGGTNIVVGMVSLADGSLEGARSLPTEAPRGQDFVVARVTEMVEAVIEETLERHGGTRFDVAGVGIGSPGPLDRASGVVLKTPNLGWTNFPLRDRVSEALELPASLDNDANCATFGEWWQGA